VESRSATTMYEEARSVDGLWSARDLAAALDLEAGAVVKALVWFWLIDET
jgi:hypothetical protein